MADRWEARREALGVFIREQRKQANLSPRAISDALHLSAETLLAQPAGPGQLPLYLPSTPLDMPTDAW